SIVNQGLNLQGLDTLDGRTQLLPALYGLSSPPDVNANDFHDITTGSAGGNQAGPGFDLVTGLGTPVANNLVTALWNGVIASPNTTGQGLGQVQRQRQGDLTAVKPLAGALGKPTPSTPTKPTNKPDHAAPTPQLQVGADQTVVLFTAPGRTSANAFPVVGEFN